MGADYATTRKEGCQVQVGKASSGSIKRYKAQLIAQGFNLQFGSDYDKTEFCHETRVIEDPDSTFYRKWIRASSDVATVFLNGTSEEEVYMK